MPKCPKCARKFTSERGLKIHANSCRAPRAKATTAEPTPCQPKFLVSLLVVLLFANFVVLAFFTTTVGDKLTEIIELTKPQSVSLTLITAADCPQCRSLESLKTGITRQNVEISTDETFSADTLEAQKLIAEFEIQKLPALILRSKNTLKKPLKESIRFGSREILETGLIWEQATPPYFDLTGQKIVGLVAVTFLTDVSCADCYDVIAVQRPILERFGITLFEEKIVDRKSVAGVELIRKYTITKVPTIILSSEATKYEKLKTAWDQVGTVEIDGSFVFRETQAVNAVYRDLKTGRVVRP